MALRTDLDDDTLQVTVHAEQHNEVNALVLGLPVVYNSPVSPIITEDATPTTLITADLAPADDSDMVWAVDVWVLGVHDGTDDVSGFNIRAIVSAYATPEAPTTWTGRVVGTPVVDHIFDPSMESVTSVELVMTETVLTIVGTGQSDTSIYWTSTTTVQVQQSSPAQDS